MNLNAVPQHKLIKAFAVTSSQNRSRLCIWVNLPDRIVIRPSANMAPANTVSLGCRIAMIAAMKNVLSPSSETMITDSEARKACMNPKSSFTILLPFARDW